MIIIISDYLFYEITHIIYITSVRNNVTFVVTETHLILNLKVTYYARDSTY